jgi:hypothetical protein
MMRLRGIHNNVWRGAPYYRVPLIERSVMHIAVSINLISLCRVGLRAG